MKALCVLALDLIVAFSLNAANHPPEADLRVAAAELRLLTDQLLQEVAALENDLRPVARSFEVRIQAVRREIDKLESTGNPEVARARILDRLDAIALDLTNSRVARQHEFGIRVEERLGKPVRHPDDAIRDEDPWLATQSHQFVNIQKSVFLGKAPGRDLEIVNGIQMNGSFVAEHSDTQVGIVFSAEAYVNTPGKRLFVRALVDGEPAAPSNVLFASGTHQGTRAFIFTTTVDAGIHTVEMQWLVDPEATAYLRTASLLIRSGRFLASAIGTLSVLTPPSGPNIGHDQPIWLDVPGVGGWIYVPKNGVLTASFSAESFVSAGKALALRALIDGAPGAPADVVFARGNAPQSRTMTFGAFGVLPGWHYVRIQWFAEAGGTATLGDRSLMLGAYASPPNQTTHAFISPPSGPSLPTIGNGFQPIPDMNVAVQVDPKGNGEAAVLFSGEIVAVKPAFALLAVDDVLQNESIIELTDGTVAGQIKSFVFEAKHLPPGDHKLELWWAPESGSVAQIGDRTMAVISERGFVPDLAEQRMFGSGKRDKEDNLHGLEPMIGDRDVLLVLWDPKRPGNPIGLDSPPGPDFILPPGFTGIVTKGEVEHLFFGASDSADDYYRASSGGKFGIHNAGVVGWISALKDPDHYFDTHPGCDTSDDEYSNENQERWSEALKSADPFVNFQQFDRNSDGVVKPAELAIVVVIPQASLFGTAHQEVLAAQCPASEPLILDGVRIVEVLEVFLNFNDSVDALNVACHELLHQMTGVDDMYDPVPVATRAGRMSIMAARNCLPHLDPAHKLAFGWVTPHLIDATDHYKLEDVKLSHTVFVLPRYNENPFGEYVLLENRQNNQFLAPLYDTQINDSGIAVWHIVEDPAENSKIPRGVSTADWNGTDQTQVRRGIRLLKPWQLIDEDGAVVDNISPLWDKADYPLLSADCPVIFIPSGGVAASLNTLSWADCTASGYDVRFLDLPAASMTLRIDVE
jgi:M6 family metalloprotease-like protein